MNTRISEFKLINIKKSGKKLVLISLTILVCTIAYSQTCNNLVLKNGSKLTSTQISYSNVVPYNPKFAKEKKQEKKDEMIAAYNADVRSGKIVGYSNAQIVANLKKNTVNGTDEYKIKASMSGFDFFYFLYCLNDTLYSCQHRGPLITGDTNNPTGYRLEGPMVMPIKVKVGDTIPSYEDINLLFPPATDVMIKKKVFAGWETNTTSSDHYGYDAETGSYTSGKLKITTTKAVYNTIDVKARQTLTYSGHIIHHVHALVTGEEEIAISGVTYKAYIIESEGWSKSESTTTYETADEKWTVEDGEEYKKIQESMKKGAIKRGWTNKQGYTVGFMKEWFVPQIGIVKFEAYDLFGGIFMINTVTALE